MDAFTAFLKKASKTIFMFRKTAVLFTIGFSIF